MKNGGEMENAPTIKTNESNLEELNKKIIEIKRKIVLKGESLIIPRPLSALHLTTKIKSTEFTI